MADRFYCPDSPVDARLTLVEDEARHLARVRRVAVGESVEVFDGRGNAYRAEVVAIGRDRVDLRVVARADSIPLPSLSLTLATAIPKGDRFDWLVEKATELGVARLIPMISERSSVDPRSTKLDRIRRAVIESCKQCRRDHLMIVDRPTPLTEVIAHRGESLGLIAHPGGQPIAHPRKEPTREAVILVGPEGGFTEHEVARAVESGWVAVGMGPTVFRVETAGIVAASTLMMQAALDDGRNEFR